ncbi:MAG: corrinoid protein [Prevotellaceae bacterium]|jgi:corrinoid protein of di/trimethylamine methyltransferase|nr:corrinoid protein [Prevotellaceae bacterium]
MKTWKQNLDETKQHLIRWWFGEGIVLTMWEHFQTGVTPHADIPAPAPPRNLNQRWFDPAWRSAYLDWYVAHSYLGADILPVANTQLGPGSLAAILGGVLEGGEDTIWIHPNPAFTDEIRFDENHPNWLLHKELLRACKRRAQGHYYVGMPDLMEGLDVLAALKGTDAVLLDTALQPERLEQQVQQINDIYFKVFDELYDIIREGDEMAFCYFSAWAPGRMTKLQSDISTMISTADFRRFVQPYLRQQCQRIEYTLYHLDGVGALHHLDALLEIEQLKAIQWSPGVGQPQGGSAKWYDLYRKILGSGKSIMASWVGLDELKPLLDHIGGEGVHLEMDFHNEAEVEQALRIVEEFTPAASPAADAAAGEPRETISLSSTASSTPAAALEPLFQAIVEGKREQAVEYTRRAIDAGTPPQRLINDYMIRAMAEVGARFQDGRAFVPQLLMAGRAMAGALELLKPLLVGTASYSAGRVVIGTVKGDLHDIGKNLVASMLEGCGFEVYNIGIDVPAEQFVAAVREYQPDILAISALLTTTMGYMSEVIDALRASGVRDNVKIMVGGAPVSQRFATQIGADGYADNANTAVAVARELVHKK